MKKDMQPGKGPTDVGTTNEGPTPASGGPSQGELPAIEYYPTAFVTWNQEADSVMSFLHGKGVDVGCGVRSLHKDMVRVDANPDVRPQHVADATALPFEDGTFDFMWSSHNLEHNVDTLAVIREARRVVKPGGYLVYIIPDKRYTAGLDPTHQHEWEPPEFIFGGEGWSGSRIPGLLLVSYGVAGPKWSFHVVYQVLEDAKSQPAPAPGVIEKGAATLQPRNYRRDPISVGSLGDHPRLTTGLGLVHRMILSGFQRALFKINVLGTMDVTPMYPGEFPYFVESVCKHDFFGYEHGASFLARTRPEVLFMVGDPGTLGEHKDRLFALGLGMIHLPMVIYFPVEGAPVHAGALALLEDVQKSGGRAITYTKWGAEQIEKQSGIKVESVPHGVDHAPFRRYPEEERQRLRELIGWQDRFVVMNLSRNKRTNRHMAYIQAAQMLKEMGHPEVLFYLHCDPEDRLAIAGLGGVNLRAMVAHYDVADMVLFPPDLHDQLHGPAYHRLDRAGALTKPSNAEARGEMFAHLSLIDRYNCADVYLDASSVQGFNLPNVEAMACGLPIWATRDGVRCEILGAAGHYMEPAAEDYWHTGALLQIVTPKAIVEAVGQAMTHMAGDGEMWRQASLAQASKFRWKECQNKFVQTVKEVVGE